ncbi:hypothetical protein OO012_19370 [Rhodobacteraceae bacterium KMM 6894]|nr:hypothetical protein [Rhodobacteraceae bacterium KMM 6894]
MTDSSLENSNSRVMQRDANGRLLPGSGGRPAGSKNLRVNGALTDLRSMSPDAVEVVRTAIANGDVRTATWLLERLLPASRVVELPGSDVQDIINALAAGDISPTEAKTIAHTIAHLKNVSEIDELRAQVDSLGRLLRGEE